MEAPFTDWRGEFDQVDDVLLVGLLVWSFGAWSSGDPFPRVVRAKEVGPDLDVEKDVRPFLQRDRA